MNFRFMRVNCILIFLYFTMKLCDIFNLGLTTTQRIVGYLIDPFVYSSNCDFREATVHSFEHGSSIYNSKNSLNYVRLLNYLRDLVGSYIKMNLLTHTHTRAHMRARKGIRDIKENKRTNLNVQSNLSVKFAKPCT